MQAVFFVQFENSNALKHRPRAEQECKQVIPSLPGYLYGDDFRKGERPLENRPLLSEPSARQEKGGFGLLHLGFVEMFSIIQD